MTRRIAVFAAKLAVSVALLIWAFSQIDLDGVLAALATVDVFWILAALAVLAAQYPLGAFRWHLIQRALGAGVAWQAVLRMHLVGIFFNQVLPSAIGGDAARVWMMGRRGVSWTQSLSSVLLDRVAFLVVLLVLMAAMLPFIRMHLADGAVRSSLTALVLVGATGLVVGLLAAPLIARILRDHRLTRDRALARSLAQLASDSGLLWRHGSRSLAIFCVGCAIQLSTFMCVWMIALAVNAEVSFGAIVAVILPAQLAMALPISIAGWGVREGAMVFGLGLAGVPSEQGIVISVLWGGLTLVGGIGCWLAWFQDPRVRDEARGFREAADERPEQAS